MPPTWNLSVSSTEGSASRRSQLAIEIHDRARRSLSAQTGLHPALFTSRVLPSVEIRRHLSTVTNLAQIQLDSSSSASADEAANECGICLDTLFQWGHDAPIVIKLNACKHAFHEDCLVGWVDWAQQNRRQYLSQTKCPLCRTPLFFVRLISRRNTLSSRNLQMVRYNPIHDNPARTTYEFHPPRQIPRPVSTSQQLYMGMQYANPGAERRSMSIPYPPTFSPGNPWSHPSNGILPGYPSPYSFIGRSTAVAHYYIPDAELTSQVLTAPRLPVPVHYPGIGNRAYNDQVTDDLPNGYISDENFESYDDQ